MDTILNGLKGFLSDYISDDHERRLFCETREFSDLVKNECRKIRTAVRQAAYALDTNHSARADYIGYLQFEISSLSNDINIYCAPGSALTLATNGLLDFLTTEFKLHFNINLPVPANLRTEKVQARMSMLEELEKLMDSNGADPALAGLVADYIKQNGYRIHTFSDLYYYNQFCDRLEELCKEESKRSLQTRLIEKLFYINFNSLPFITYCSAMYPSEAEHKQQRSSLEMETTLCLQNLSHKPQHKGLAFDDSDRPLRTMLKEMVKYQQERIFEQKQSNTDHLADLPKKPFITAHMNVNVLTIIARAAHSSNTFTTDTYVNLYSFIADHVMTKNHPGPLSATSIKNKTQSADTNDAAVAVRHLHNVIHQIVRKYNLEEHRNTMR
ncbi:hypothetical protein SAMN06265348_113228 [Pedobacter westerhofensis]|uniref:Uncharacterized protein n=1 Tax=Pedobacter westerhofensis TaxID=425512 RepID=A0A521FLI3_9SPHI|nr:hypothetical protein [Pedobacter westerhofensis]SMO97062.1 hypothetical protein SAMN06265348_113228 [Pedobacter westerhofensis]